MFAIVFFEKYYEMGEYNDDSGVRNIFGGRRSLLPPLSCLRSPVEKKKTFLTHLHQDAHRPETHYRSRAHLSSNDPARAPISDSGGCYHIQIPSRTLDQNHMYHRQVGPQ
jgi:hypothetical protein